MNNITTYNIEGGKAFLNQVFKQWFVSAKTKETAQKIERMVVEHKLGLPKWSLVNNVDAYKFIKVNHLHHKITKQHVATGLGISRELKFPMGGKWVDFTEVPSGSGLEFLADGLEIHDAKKWDQLRPLYKLTLNGASYDHIDTLTGQRETIGKAGKNYIQLVTVKPWGWNPRGGSLFGHTWIRFVADGKLYHVGANLNGQILNPDFMATLSLQGKECETTDWVEMDAAQTKRLFSVNFVHESRPFVARTLFGSHIRAALDVLWSLLPSPIRRLIHPIQVVTRGSKPGVLADAISSALRTAPPAAPRTVL